MRLRRLEIAGFKSVARKTVLSFPGAITCIAGPNGCGKSNIVDAIRWALGEQSPKALRAPSMEDIIFSGTQGLPPSGMARVSLEFTRDGDYFPKTLDGFDEISIARSLYRTGESVYTLNHVKCRLKDITDIFLDTGLDRRGYAIIEQGKIKDIINSDPEEIRYLVEEVAEVGRLRYKKAEASRRLKATQSNLVRIQDLLSEVSRQRDDLRAQANKAKRYQKLNNSLNSMTRELWAFELRQLGIAREKLEHRLFELRESKEKKTKEIKSRLDLLQKLEKELKQGGRRLKQLEASVLKARATLDSTGSSIAILNSRLTELGTEMRRLSEDIKASTKRDLAQRQEAAKLKKDIYHATKEISNVEHIVVSRQTDIQRLKNEYRKVLEEYEDKRARLFDLSGRQKALEQDLISTRSRMKEAVKASGQKQAELDEMKSSKERARAEMSSLEDKRRVLDKNLERIETRLGDLEERQLRLVRELDNLIKILRENEKVYSELNVKISMLDRMIAEGLGVPGDNDIEHRTGTKRVADSIRVKPGYEDAVGRSIGDGLGYVVVESYDQVRELIKERKAELGFVPLKPNVSNGDMGKIPEVAEILGPLRNYIDVASDFNEVVEALASGMVVVKGIEDAMRLWEKGYRSVTMVSLDGKVLEPTGVIRCNVEGKRYASGLRARSERENLLRQKDLVRADMRVLDGKIAIKRAEVDAIIQEIEGERKRRQDTRIELERITMEIGEARLRLKAITGDIGKAEVDIESWDDMVKRLSNELEQKESSKQGLDSELDDLRIELTTLGGKKDELYNKMADEEHLLEKESARMRDMKISLARMEERVNAINEEISRKSGNLDEMKHMIKDLAVQLRSNRQRLGILSRQKGEAESTILEMEAERDNLRAGYKKLEERIGLLEKEIQSLTAEVEDAMRLWEKGYRSVTMVSLDGKVLEPTGVIRCNVEGKRYASGLRARSERENLLRQKDLVRADMRVLDGKIAIKRAEVDAIIQEIEGERKRRQDTRIELERITMEIGEARLRLKAITGDIGKAEVDIESWDDMVKRLSNELEQKESSKQGLDSELDDLRIELTTLGGKKDELYNKMADEEHLLEKESARMRDMKISLARMEERVNAINEEISRKSGNLDEMKHMIKDLAVQLRSNRQRLGILSRQKGEAESTILEMEAERDNLRAGYKKLEERIGLLEKEIQSLTAEVERLKKQENEYLLEHRERDISYSMLLQRLESRFGKKELRLPEGFDPEVTKQKMARIQRRIENMGQINFVALEAFEDAQSRWERLHVQYQDLSQAMERLQQVINNLEKQSSRRFLSTFEKVRANFRDIFGMLFNGGKADLVLASLGDAGQGIEIKASPPFKRIKNMSLLSDGEKVLCAISFVFSLFKVRPSPFCVLDEVDASLDEANTLRFNRLIKAYSKDTQFIMITHNKHTMEIADIIYGVTFDTPGVSKVVAMDLKEMDE